MIQSETIVKITDNGGGKIGKVFKILGGSKKRYAEIGDFVVISVKSPNHVKQSRKKISIVRLS
jgi:large subunit ribosomal protein L14